MTKVRFGISESEDEDFRGNRSIFITNLSPSPFPSESLLPSYGSELSLPLKNLDPAHMPSPRMLHVLKSCQSPVTVTNGEREDEPWSSFIANHPELESSRPHDTVSQVRALSRTMSLTDQMVYNMGESRRPSDSDLFGLLDGPMNYSSSFLGSDRVSLCVFCLALAFLLAIVPTLSIVNASVGAEKLLSFDIMVTHTLVTLGTWVLSTIVVFGLFLAGYTTAISCRNLYRRRKVSLQEAVQFARETMPEYGSLNSPVRMSPMIRRNSNSLF